MTRKIAILRANAIGDFFFALPALEAIRHAYPGAEIVYLGRTWHAEFLHHRPGPWDRVLAVPPCSGVNEDRGGVEDNLELEQFFAAMQEERFDLAVQMHGGGRHSNPFVAQLGAAVTAGFEAPDAPALDLSVPYRYFQPEILRCLELAALVGAPPVTLEPRLKITAQDLEESFGCVPPADKDLVLLNPNAGDGRRIWPPEKFAAVGDGLTREGAQVVINGPAGEKTRADMVAGLMSAEAIVAGEQLSLRGLAGLTSRCRVVVSNDSGPLHMAAAVGAAVAGIYWCGNLLTAGPATRRRNRALAAWRIHCPECGRDCIADNCEHHCSFVADVPTDEVLSEALDLYRSAPAAAGMQS